MDSAVPNVPTFLYHGRYYYRPHYCTVLAQVASVQLHKEAYENFMNTPQGTPVLERNMPRPPSDAKLRMMVFVKGAPKSWWKSLDPYRGHIMLLQQVAGEGKPENANMLMDWLLRYTEACAGTTASTG